MDARLMSIVELLNEVVFQQGTCWKIAAVKTTSSSIIAGSGGLLAGDKVKRLKYEEEIYISIAATSVSPNSYEKKLHV